MASGWIRVQSTIERFMIFLSNLISLVVYRGDLSGGCL